MRTRDKRSGVGKKRKDTLQANVVMAQVDLLGRNVGAGNKGSNGASGIVAKLVLEEVEDIDGEQVVVGVEEGHEANNGLVRELVFWRGER